MKFTKMEGCGNDFIVTNEATEPHGIERFFQKAPLLCDRRRGIGADGIILVMPSSRADVAMRIINADGSEAEMCGNGIRCLAAFIGDSGAVRADALAVETAAGIIRTQWSGSDIRVDMGAPVLNGPDIPTRSSRHPVTEETITADGTTYMVTAVSMGNPHAVVHVPDLTDHLVNVAGPCIEQHEFFPNRVNVEFIKVISHNEISMRVYERGVGETMACGTGACAAMVAGVLTGRNGNHVTVHLLGGDLVIEWSGKEADSVFMTGPARCVYQGEIAGFEAGE